MGRLLHQQHFATSFGRLLGRPQTRNSATNDQHVDSYVHMFVVVRIPMPRRLPKPGRLANERLINMLPERARPEKHFVVKPSRQKPRQLGVNLANVVLQRRPVVLALRLQAVEQLSRCGPRIRLERLVAPEVHQRVRLFRPACHDAPRPVILERPPDQHLPSAEQRRGQCVALIPLQGLPVELEGNRFRAVDKPPACVQTMAHEKVLHVHPGTFAVIASFTF